MKICQEISNSFLLKLNDIVTMPAQYPWPCTYCYCLCVEA